MVERRAAPVMLFPLLNSFSTGCPQCTFLWQKLPRRKSTLSLKLSSSSALYKFCCVPPQFREQQ
jgi:hypothetical protein